MLAGSRGYIKQDICLHLTGYNTNNNNNSFELHTYNNKCKIILVFTQGIMNTIKTNWCILHIHIFKISMDIT